MKKRITLTVCCFSVMFFLLQLVGRAQAVGTEEIRAQMVKNWQRAKNFTDEYLSTMPADKYSIKVNDSVRSFAQQMLHLASGNIFLMMNATDAKPPEFFGANIENSKTAQTKDSVVYYVNASYDYCTKAVKDSDAGRWGEKKKLFGFEETRLALMMKTFEHQTHHRGQATMYIRYAGIKPPQERLFEK